MIFNIYTNFIDININMISMLQRQILSAKASKYLIMSLMKIEDIVVKGLVCNFIGLCSLEVSKLSFERSRFRIRHPKNFAC